MPSEVWDAGAKSTQCEARCGTMTPLAAVHRSDGNAAPPRSPTVARSSGRGSQRAAIRRSFTAHVDDELDADRIEPDGTLTRHADVAAELLRSIGHPDGAANSPH
jgi:hypothetical protein